MEDQDKTKEQLEDELIALRYRVAKLEASEAARLSAEQASKQAEERIRHMTTLLRAIRMVNQLIAREMELEEERRQTEEALEGAHAGLERRVEERTAELARVNEELRREISERKRVEHVLRLSEARYRAGVEDQTELTCCFLPDGTLTFVNEAFCRYFGKERQELIGQHLVPLIPDEHREEVEKQLASPSRKKPATTFELRIAMPNGEVSWLQATVRPLFDEPEHPFGFQCLARDITKQKRLEEQLRQAHRMQAVGQLASDCAHHLNNLLTVINGYAQFIISSLDAENPLRKDAEAILKAGERAASLTNQLLAFGRRQKVQTRGHDLSIYELSSTPTGFMIRSV